MLHPPIDLRTIALDEYLLDAAADDAVITASNRLAMEIRGRLGASVRSGAVLLPEVTPYAQWLRGAWNHFRFQGVFVPESPIAGALLLSDTQEALLWETVLRQSGAGERLLFLDETVDACMHSAELAELYQVPWEHGSWDRDEESKTFRGWYRRVREVCRARKWMLPARLPAFLKKSISEWPALRGQRIFLAGFEEMAPAQSALFQEVAAHARGMAVLETREAPRGVSAGPQRASVEICSAPDDREELRAAATWAAEVQAEYPRARIAVVVPDLASRRVQVEEAFLGALHPGWHAHAGFAGTRRFNVTLGEPLSANPVAAAGLALLDWLRGDALLADVRYLLRCPYFAREPQERRARASLEAMLLRQRADRVSLRSLREAAIDTERRTGESLREWCAALLRLEAVQVQGRELPSVWARRVRALWVESLWLGDPPLSSAEFQARHRALEELGALAELDAIDGVSAVTPGISFREFAGLLRRRLLKATFQPESRPAPVLVAGLFEVTGLAFDAAWVCGLNDTVLPRPPRLDPFLPGALQRELNLPGSTPAREIAFGSRSFERLLGLAPRLVLSYPRRREQAELEPSPFVRALVAGHRLAIHEVSLPSALPSLPPAPLEEIPDWQAGPLPVAQQTVRRGVQVLADQSDCPFRAFARTRLGCDPQEAESDLMNRLDQGSFVHRALEEFWKRTGSLETLQGLSTEELDARLVACTEIALQDFEISPGNPLTEAQRDAERIRIRELLTRWIGQEQQRRPFRVAAMERDRRATIGGVTLGIRPDRVDELDDGTVALIDYKTGGVTPSSWQGDRPAQPQLLVYLCAEERPVSALAFASLKTAEICWKAAGRNLAGNFLVEGKPAGGNPAWDDFIHASRQTVGRLATQFRDGFAPVDPAPDRDPCEYCEQKPLCRIAEWRQGDDAEDAEGDTQ